MKPINHTAGVGNLIGVLVSLSMGFALILFNASGTSANSTQIFSPIDFNSCRAKVQQIYTSQIGVREKGLNTGPEVEKYLRYVHLSKGNPWCAAFVCWVLGQAGVPNPRSGWSPDLFGEGYVIWARRGAYPSSLATGNRQLATPGTGDIFGLYFPEKARIAHVGFIDQWDDTWMISVEGNTNLSGSREGDGVYRKRRLVRTIYKVARYVDRD